MRYISGWVESIVLRRKVGDFFRIGVGANEEKYIEREYTIAGNHLMLTSEHTAKEIEQKAKKVMGMLKRGIKFIPTQPNVIAILEKLKQSK